MKRLSCLLAVTLGACHALPALHYYSLAAVSPLGVASHPDLPMLIHVRHVSVPHEMDHLGQIAAWRRAMGLGSAG